jgi:hypothetical protein
VVVTTLKRLTGTALASAGRRGQGGTVLTSRLETFLLQHGVLGHFDVVPQVSPDDVLQLVAEHENQNRRGAIARSEFVGVDDALNDDLLVGGVHPRAGPTPVVGEPVQEVRRWCCQRM